MFMVDPKKYPQHDSYICEKKPPPVDVCKIIKSFWSVLTDNVYYFFVLQQAISLEKGKEKGEGEVKVEVGVEGKKGEEQPEFNWDMISECQKHEKASDDDIDSMMVCINLTK